MQPIPRKMSGNESIEFALTQAWRGDVRLMLVPGISQVLPVQFQLLTYPSLVQEYYLEIPWYYQFHFTLSLELILFRLNFLENGR